MPIGTSSFTQTFSAAAAVKGQQDSPSHPGGRNEKKNDDAKASTSQPETEAPIPVAAQPAAPQPVSAAKPFGTQTSAGDDQPGSQIFQPATGSSNGVVGYGENAAGELEQASPAGSAPEGVVADGEEPVGDVSTAKSIAEGAQAADTAAVMQQAIPFALEQAPIAGVNGPDLSAMAGDGKSLTDISSVKDGISKPAGTFAKDSKADSSDVRSKQKSTDSSIQNSAAPSNNSLSFKVAETMAHADHGGSAMQPGANDAMVQQAAQAAVSAATEGKQATVHIGDNGAAAPQVAAQASGNVDTTNAAVADAQSLSAVNSARLIQSMHQSEMRLGMYSAEFGSISISTSLTHQSIAAQISMDHSALGHALSAHLSAIEEKLSNAYGVQARVEVRDGSASSGNSSAHSGEKQQGQAKNSVMSSSPLPNAMRAITHSTSALASDTSRLDIRI